MLTSTAQVPLGRGASGNSCRSGPRIALPQSLGAAFVAAALCLFTPAVVAADVLIAPFSVDVTIPLGHRCMGVLPVKSQRIADPLYAKGFVLLGAEKPLVVCSVDWCEIRNGAYDEFRRALAEAASTTPDVVLLSSIHQHDAPVVDADAARLLAEHGLEGELHDEVFFDEVLRRVAAAVRDSLAAPRPVTHLGLGRARVERIASNRRVIGKSGRVQFARGSSSGRDPFYRDAPEGEIDPMLAMISFYDGDEPVVALHAYATHPMSYYGRGEVSADFVGDARARLQQDNPDVLQIYASGCSGDVTAGKYNDGTPASRKALADRLYQAMVRASATTKKTPIERIDVRVAKLELEFHPRPELHADVLAETLADESRSVEERILAAMSLASRRRVERGDPIDMPCIDFGPAQIVLFPGESFVAYQLMAQQLRPESLVVSLGYGECWPGYIPTEAAFGDNFTDKWLWAAPGSEARMRAALEQIMPSEPK